jgi:anthranilate synthase/aminodeoxychorismate synthase-like glutamine amidotransferase
VDQLAALRPDRLILSPGPQTPQEAGITLEAINYFCEKIPILGICLGHQAIGMNYGAPLLKCPVPMHGKTSMLEHNNHPLFEGINSPTEVMRYHSLCIDISDNKQLLPLAFSEDDKILMACAHRTLPLIGLQFHPESIGTIAGQPMIDNWAKMKF